MAKGLKLSHKMLILVVLPLVFEFCFVLVLSNLLAEAERERQNEFIARSIITHVNEVHRILLDNATAGAGFTLAVDKEKRAQRDARAREKIEKEERILTKALADYPAAREHFERAQKLMRDGADQLRVLKRILRDEGILATKDRAQQIFGNLTKELDKILEEERKAEELYPKVQTEQRKRIQSWLFIGVVLNTVIAFVVVVVVIRELTGRLSVLMDNTVRLARGLPLSPPIKGNDELAHLDHTFREMAEALTLASMRERAVVDNTADMIFSVSKAGVLERVNPASAELLGRDADDLLGAHYVKYIVADEREATVKELEQARYERTSKSFENRMLREDGTVVDTLWSVTWSETDGSYFCVAHNITDRKQLERMKQDFVSMVSHDLRTPLTAVQNYLELLEDGIYGELNQSGRDRLSQMGKSIDRLVKLICDLLDIDRLESGHMKLRKSEQNVQHLLEQAVGACSAMAAEKNVKVVAPTTPLVLNVDGDRVVQVMVNLVSNAIKFSPDGGTVSVAVEDVGESVSLRVTDEGCGIAAEYLRTIFDRFKQAPEGEENRSGTGLGLAISKAIVEQHGGAIGVESEVGKGSTFWFSIPK